MKKSAYLLCVLVAASANAGAAFGQIGGAPGQNFEAFPPPVRTPVPYGAGMDAFAPPGAAPGTGAVPPPEAYGGAPSPYAVSPNGNVLAEYAPFDPSLCNYRQPYGWFYMSADAMYWDRTEPFRREIAVRAAGGVPRLRTSDPNFTHEVFPRLTFGYHAPSNWALEGSIYYKDDFDAIANYGETDQATATFFGVQPEPSDWSSADQINLRMASGLHSYEINAINTIGGIQPIFGVRYMEFRDRATFSAFDNAFRSDAFIGTYNMLLGPQVGAKVGYQFGLLGVEAIGKVGWFYNDAKTSTLIRDLNNTTIYRDVHRNGQNDACVFETGVMAYYNPLTWLSVRLGYQALGIINTSMAVDQISEVRVARGNTTGIIPDAHGDIIYHGIYLGLEGRW